MNNENSKKCLEIQFENYELVVQISEKYFSYLYQTIVVSLAFLSAASAFGFDANSWNDPNVRFLIFSIIINTILCGSGLLYGYNIHVLARSGYVGVQLEHQLVEYTKKNSEYLFTGWMMYSKRDRSGFILAYGAIYAIYILAPLVTIYVGNSMSINYTGHLLYTALAYIIYGLAIVFQFYINIQTYHYIKDTNDYIKILCANDLINDSIQIYGNNNEEREQLQLKNVNKQRTVKHDKESSDKESSDKESSDKEDKPIQS